MKRIASILLTLALLLSLCVFGGVASADSPVISPENGFQFVEPLTDDDLDNAGSSSKGKLAFTDLKETAAFEPSIITPKPYSAKITYPTITRSFPDKDGTVTYTVSYTLYTGVKALVPRDYKDGFSCQLGLHAYSVYDLYTGQEITAGRQLYSKVETEGQDQAEFLNELELDGETISVAMESGMNAVWDDAQWDKRVCSRTVTVDSTTTLYAPADYDGLILGIDTGDSIYEEMQEEAKVFDEVNFWDDYENLENWRFFRVSDYAEYETLQKGSQSEAVKTLQQMLSELGYLKTWPDGFYGDNTAAAVKAFQEAAGLDRTGIADDATQTALLAAFEAQPNE